jgi:hypothetical protein
MVNSWDVGVLEVGEDEGGAGDIADLARCTASKLSHGV